MFELMDAYSQSAVIKVIGVGGGGGNAGHVACAGKSYEMTLKGAVRGDAQSDAKLGARAEVV